MRAAFALAALFAGLLGCTRPAPVPDPGFRDRTRPIASAALVDMDRLSGEWHVVATYPGFEDCLSEVWRIVPDSLVRICDGSGQETGLSPGAYPGRFLTDAPVHGTDTLWVLWVDFDYRTMVIGTPGGQGGWILDRNPAIPADRMTAAREMLDFNGYDLASLTRR